jgi:hypothetical protein
MISKRQGVVRLHPLLGAVTTVGLKTIRCSVPDCCEVMVPETMNPS